MVERLAERQKKILCTIRGVLQPKITLLALLALLTACRVGGGLSAGIDEVPDPIPVVDVPTIVFPARSTYYSQESSLTITGMCGVGQTVTLAGDEADTQACADDASYRFKVSRSADGVYSFLITQTDHNNHISKPASLVWVRKTSVSPPKITNPAASPFASALSAISIGGTCETGATISLGGDGVGDTICSHSRFAISLPKPADGTYTIQVTQTDLAGNTAASEVVWHKQALVVTPASPVIGVQTLQAFTITGGSGIYTIAVESNNTGGVLDADAYTYTSGPIAGETDILRVTDSLETVSMISVTTVAGAADHLEISDGDLQVGHAGEPLDDPLQVKVVDRYGNGIPAVALVFQVLDGDAKLGASGRQISDADGFAEVPLAFGYGSLHARVRVSALSAPLPDAAGSGDATVVFQASASTSNHGPMGLEFAIGIDPSHLVIADFDGDSKKDAAVLNAGDNKVGVLRGVGNGLFSAMVSYSVGGGCLQPAGLVAGDFDGGDGLDLAVICNGSDSLARLENDGGGQFTLLAPVATDFGPVAVLARDLNGDDDLDLVVVSGLANTVGIMFGNGDFSFDAPVPYGFGNTATPSPSAAAFGDFNHDSVADIVVTNSGEASVSLLRGTGNGVFAAAVQEDVGVGPSAVAAADFDGDSFDDLVVANSVDNSVSVLINDGTGDFGFPADIGVGSGPNALLTTDLNADGNADFAVVNGDDGTISIHKGRGDGTFVAAIDYTTQTAPAAVAVADANGDGALDLFVTTGGNQILQVFPGDGNGHFGFDSATGLTPIAATVGDFDGDGNLDQAVVNSAGNSVTLLKGLGNGLFESAGALVTGSQPVAIRSYDFNHDGDLDLVVANQTSNSVSFFKGNGDLTFLPRNDTGAGASPLALEIADVTGDGHADIVVAVSGTSVASILDGNGDGTFDTKREFSTGGSPAAVAIADFDGDEIVDIATANSGAGTISLLLGSGGGAFRAKVDYAAGSSPSGLIVADFNGDTVMDLVTMNTGNGTVSFLRGVGDGSFFAPTEYDAGTAVTGLVSGDFNGDAQLDLAAANGVNQTFSILTGTGSGVFNNPTPYYPLAFTNGLVAGDFNGDGKTDLSVLDTTNNQVHSWLGQ